ncbi:MAG TPA: hypothetical protein VN086_02120 [Candidatus Paceibacterota bacterium]|nr:hypothetical protein [Candidatus Paceibacterota bacterium]
MAKFAERALNICLTVYKPRHNGHTIKERFTRFMATVVKSAIIMSFAIPYSLFSTLAWYFILYRNHYDLGDGAEIVATAAWLPYLAVATSIINASILAKVLDEFKEMRYAIKQYDVEKFMMLSDEDVSPLIYALLIVFDACIVGGFMLIHYDSMWHGAFIIWTSTYVMALILLVIRELDDPLQGVWYIRNVHKEWLDMDRKSWRALYYASKKEESLPIFFGLLVTSNDTDQSRR